MYRDAEHRLSSHFALWVFRGAVNSARCLPARFRQPDFWGASRPAGLRSLVRPCPEEDLLLVGTESVGLPWGQASRTLPSAVSGFCGSVRSLRPVAAPFQSGLLPRSAIGWPSDASFGGSSAPSRRPVTSHRRGRRRRPLRSPTT